MPRFLTQIHGQNFWITTEGRCQRLGFYTPRFVDAPDADKATQLALEDFQRSDRYLELIRSTRNHESDPPLLGVEDIDEVSSDVGDDDRPAGLAFYKQDAEN
jgi:hypothetical protein